MTIDVTTPVQTHPIDGIGPYGTTWPYAEGSVTAGIVGEDGIVFPLDPADFTVTPLSSDVAGNVHLTPEAAALHHGSTLLLERATAEEQGWIGNMSARERGLETQLDLIVMAGQERRSAVARSLRATVPLAAFAPGPLGSTLIRTADGYGPGPTADQISAAQTASEGATAAAASAGASAALAEIYGPLTYPNAAAFFASAVPDVTKIGKRAGTQDGLAWDIVANGAGDFDHPVTGVGLRLVGGGSGAVVADQAGADRTGVASASDAVQAVAGSADVAALRPGEYRMVPGPTSPYTHANTASNVYRAVALTQSGRVIEGQGAVLHGVSRPGVAAGDVQPVFATDKEVSRAAVTDLTFDGLIWDSENDADATNSNQRFLYASGVTRLRLLNTTALSSGNRRGYYAHIHNAADVQISGHRHHNVTGGLNLRFVQRVTIWDAIFDRFSEAIDLDGPEDQMIIGACHFEGTSRINQAIDLNEVRDVLVGPITVRNLGNIATINHKTTTQDNYTDYLSNAFVKNINRSQRVMLRGITGKGIGEPSIPAIFIGWDWTAGSLAGSGEPRDVLVGDVVLHDTSGFWIRDASGLTLENITLRGVLTATGGYEHAITAFSAVSTGDQLAWSDLGITLRNITIDKSDRGGVSISRASRVQIDGLHVSGGQTLGGTENDLRIRDCEYRGTVASIDGLDIEGNVTISGDSTTISAWAADTYYQTNRIVSNGGLYYRAVAEGRSAPSGGPTGTGLTDIVDDGTAGIAAWVGSTAYVVGDLRSNGGAYFVCHTAGTSAASGGPSGTDQRIQDGTAVWRPINGAAKWRWIEKPYKIMWGRKNRIRGKVTLSGDAERHIEGEVVSSFLGNLAATGTVLMPIFTARRRSLVTHVSYATAADVIAHGTNYRNLILRRARAGATTNISTIDTSATGFTALVNRDAPLKATVGASFPAGAYLEPGDVLLVNSNHAASGVAMTGLGVTAHLMEY